MYIFKTIFVSYLCNFQVLAFLADYYQKKCFALFMRFGYFITTAQFKAQQN